MMCGSVTLKASLKIAGQLLLCAMNFYSRTRSEGHLDHVDHRLSRLAKYIGGWQNPEEEPTEPLASTGPTLRTHSSADER